MRTTLAFALLALAASASAAPLAPRDYYTLRQRAFTLDDHAAAAAAYDSLTRTYDGDGAVWLELGNERYALGQFGEASRAYRRAFALGHGSRAETAYQVAQSEARAAHTDSAFAWLERALAHGYENRPEIAGDSAFVALRGDRRFATVAGALPDRTFTRDEGWRYDLDYLVGEVRRMHYLYRSQPLPAEFTAGAAALRTRIPKLTDLGVALEMQRLMAMLGDGHSTMYPGAAARVPMAPAAIALHAFDDGIYVMDAADKALIGARVTRIGGHEVADVLRRMDPYMSRDNANVARVLAPYLMSFPSALHELGLVPSPGALPLAGTRRDGSAFEVTLPASKAPMHPHIPKLAAAAFEGAPAAPAYLTRVEEPFWFEDLGDSAVWFQFNQVANGEKETLSQAAVRLRRYVDEHATRALVIDLRNNNGGNGYLLTSLLRTLVHFETTRPGARTFVITGPYTFSAAQTFISQVDRLTNATFVGEPSGSRPTFVGEDTQLYLPWSGSRGSVSTRLHTSYPVEERIWIAPEIPVPARAADWLAGRDAAREAVLAILGQPAQ